MENPWLVENVQDFSFLCCPECIYRSKEVQSFEVHAIENHPQSMSLFGKKDLLDPTEEEAIKEESDQLEGSQLYVSCELNNEDFLLEQDFDDEEDLPLMNKRGKSKKWIKPDGKTYQCPFCPEYFNRRKDMYAHKNSMHSQLECQDCSEIFATPKQLTRHRYNKHNKTKCEKCDKSFVNLAVYKKHLQTMHADKDNNLVVQCDACPYTTHSQIYLTQHKYRNHPMSSTGGTNDQDSNIWNVPHSDTKNGNVICPECSEEVSYSRFVCHFKLAHGQLPSWYPQSRKLICDQCSKEFATKKSLEMHLKRHEAQNDPNVTRSKPKVN